MMVNNTDRQTDIYKMFKDTDRQSEDSFYIDDGVILENRIMVIPVTEENRTETVSS